MVNVDEQHLAQVALHKSHAVAYLPLVQKLAKRLGRRLPAHVSQDDLVSAGVVGLLEAMERFEPSRATDFAVYAEFRIKGAMLDELRRADYLARDTRTQVKKIEQATIALTQSLGRLPQETELADFLKITLADLQKILERLVHVRLVSFHDLEAKTAHIDNPFEQTSKQQSVQRLKVAMEKLNIRQQQILQLYYQEELTLKEIGVVLDVSESRVCQLLSTITLQLRALLKTNSF